MVNVQMQMLLKLQSLGTLLYACAGGKSKRRQIEACRNLRQKCVPANVFTPTRLVSAFVPSPHMQLDTCR